jgi:hypothetical protein
MADPVHFQARDPQTNVLRPLCGPSQAGPVTGKGAEVTCGLCLQIISLLVPTHAATPRPPSDLDAFRTMLQHAGVEHDEAPIWGPFVGAAQTRTGTTVSLIAPRSHLVFGSTFTFDSHGNLISIDGHGK